MAKKRRLSKRDREIKFRMQDCKKWASFLDNEELFEKIDSFTREIDPSESGHVYPVGKKLMYQHIDEDGCINITQIAYFSSGKVCLSYELPEEGIRPF